MYGMKRLKTKSDICLRNKLIFINDEFNVNSLPSEIILEILSYLDYKDLVSCSFLNKRFNRLSKHGAFWKQMCKTYWLDTKCPRNRTWKEQFANWFTNMGYYIDEYAVIKSAWNKMKKYLHTRCTPVFKTIRGGATEEQLNKLEAIIGLKLPKDFRCSYRIHNGQRNTYTGLMGNCYHYQTSQRLLDIDKICDLVEQLLKIPGGVRGCIPLTFYSWYSSRGHIAQYLAISDRDGYSKDTVFHLAYKVSKQEDDAFITGKSFKEWIISYADHLSSGHFLLQNGKISRFRADPVCEKTVGFIKISVMISFQPEISQVNPPRFEFDYRFVFTLSEDAPTTESCILKSSVWITDNGKDNEVFRVRAHKEPRELRPGGFVTWATITAINSTHGTVTGIVHFENMLTGEISFVDCPVAPLNCLPFITAEERKVKYVKSSSSHSKR